MAVHNHCRVDSNVFPNFVELDENIWPPKDTPQNTKHGWIGIWIAWTYNEINQLSQILGKTVVRRKIKAGPKLHGIVTEQTKLYCIYLFV